MTTQNVEKTDLKTMLRIRYMEQYAEAAYQQGHVGGFFHSYIGQEAVQVSCMSVFGQDNWWITSYRCHALALLCGASINEIFAELYGKVTGNAAGRGGSMHLYGKRLMGGFGIVGGQTPIAAGAAFALKYKGIKNACAICFLGDGAAVQGVFHETLNLAAMWTLPVLYIIENNNWSMGTGLGNTHAVSDNLAARIAYTYDIKSDKCSGMDYYSLMQTFENAKSYINQTGKPMIIEVNTERFRGHSISDPGNYRTKESLQESKSKDSIRAMENILLENKIITEDELMEYKAQLQDEMKSAMSFAEKSAWPTIDGIEREVMAP
ncbi:thiamine pyrophosphate-dependent enzyme [Chlamydiia bacterium]|jgi:pyruvate dehydrogenase E1 component alpha subunit|nr:thiamine pyrophosphate-dependent enzyme [Chlamydiia bacterium]